MKVTVLIETNLCIRNLEQSVEVVAFVESLDDGGFGSEVVAVVAICVHSLHAQEILRLRVRIKPRAAHAFQLPRERQRTLLLPGLR